MQPLGGGGHPGPDDGDFIRVVVRLIRVHGTAIAGELRGEREPRVARCEQDMAEDAVAVEREAAVDAPDP